MNAFKLPGLLHQLAGLRSPLDVREAHANWGANCGPAALAAALGRDIADVVASFPNFPDRPYTNLPMMVGALNSLGLSWSKVDDPGSRDGFPTNGVVLIRWISHTHSPSQFNGIQRRHWIAVASDFVYEINLDSWVPRQLWETGFLPILAKDHPQPGAWVIDAGYELDLAAQG